MSRQTRELPRWKRGRQPAPAPTVVQLRRREARAFTRELSRGNAEAPVTNATLAATGAWRFRRHTAPFIWLTGLLAASALQAAPHPLLCGLAASLVVPSLMVLCTRHLPSFPRHWTAAAAALTSLWLPFLAVRGLRPCLVAVLLTWVPFAGAWVRHYRWRATPQEPEPEEPGSDVATWEKLAGRRRWAGKLDRPEEIEGGRKWQIVLDGTETHIGQVMAEPRAIAAAWDKPQTEAYAEPDPSGVESRGILTILRGGTLEEVREWDGTGFGEDGTARIGRFADSAPARIRLLVPMDGTRHSIIAGVSGSGKSALLDLLVWLALTSPIPIVPVILDPQNGQSLPQWRGKVLYAAGLDECVRMERGLSAGMLDRSLRLASMTWDDDGHKVKGMEFFDARLSGKPVVMVITDEAPYLLSGGGNAKLATEMIRLKSERAKLGRKAGDAEALVAQVPSLGELGDQALRAQLVGGNVVALRTGEKVSAGMLGLQADPSALPKYFPNGEATGGIGYVVSVDNRQAPFRTDRVPSQLRHRAVEVPELEPEFLEAMDRAMGGISPTASFPPPPRTHSPKPAAAEPAEEAPAGRRCIDAVWQVLSDRAADMDRGEVIKWVSDLAGSWDRKPWSIRAVGSALRDLVDGKEPGRTVTKPRDGVYRAVVSDTTPQQSA